LQDHKRLKRPSQHDDRAETLLDVCCVFSKRALFIMQLQLAFCFRKNSAHVKSEYDPVMRNLINIIHWLLYPSHIVCSLKSMKSKCSILSASLFWMLIWYRAIHKHLKKDWIFQKRNFSNVTLCKML
jgi:hypothetical protein